MTVGREAGTKEEGKGGPGEEERKTGQTLSGIGGVVDPDMKPFSSRGLVPRKITTNTLLPALGLVKASDDAVSCFCGTSCRNAGNTLSGASADPK